MYGAADLAGHKPHIGPIPADLREDIDNVTKQCQAPTDASLVPCDAWHERAQSLLAEILRADDQMSIQPDLWNQVTEALGEAENILQTRCLSDDEVDIINQIAMVAVESAPLYPCVSQCAKLWYEIRASAERAQGLPHNASAISFKQRSPVAFQLGASTPLKPVSLQGGNLPHDPESYKHLKVLSQAETSTLFHRRCRQPLWDFWSHPVGSRGQCAYAVERSPSREELEHFKADLANQGSPPALISPPAEELAGLDSVTDWKISHNDALPRNVTLVEEHVAKLIADLDHAHRSAGPAGRSFKLVNVKQRLKMLCTSLSELNNESPPLNARMLAILDNMRSVLLNARAKLKYSSCVRMSHRYMAMLDTAVFKLSQLWHQARLANVMTGETLRPQEFESLREMTNFPEDSSPVRCVASTTYAALLTANNDDEAREVVHDFLTFSDVTSRSIDLTTAKLYLLILLFLKHDNVKLFKRGVRGLLGKLISRLRGEIFESTKTEISIYQMPEFKEFCLAYFKAGPCRGFDWRDSLRVNNSLVRDGRRPIVAKLLQYGSSFCNGANQLMRLITSASLVFNKRKTYATQVESLAAFRRHLLSIDSPTNVFADDQTLAYLKQFATFAKTCLHECEVEGRATCREQVQILEVTLSCLQWCRLLSSYLEVVSPSPLKESYDMVAHALILKSIWSHETTTVFCNSERAFISQGIMSALKSNNVDDDLLVCTRILLDRNVPSKFVEIRLDELLLHRTQKTSDHDKMVTLLATACRMDLFRLKLVADSNIPPSTKKVFAEALIQARLVAKGVHILPAPDVALSASLQERFIASSADEAARHLSLDVVLAEALKETKSDYLTVSEVARHVATHLLGDSINEQWLDFLTCQVNWCLFTPKQLSECQGELMTLVQGLGTFLKAFWYEDRWVKPLDSCAEATPNLVRHFVNTVTLKWLLSKLRGNSMCSAENWEFLCKVAGDHFFAWMPKWMIFMHASQALFPSNVIVDSIFFARLCVDLSRQMQFNAPPKARVGALLDNFEVSARLRRLVKGISFGILTRQDFEALLEPHQSPFLSRWNTNVFLTFLLCAWHDGSLPVDRTVIEECIGLVVNESAFVNDDVGMTVNTLQSFIAMLL
eukprot:Blabericola_migrator_1__2632@NODE_1744_length_3879_cov_23_527807_g1125_i0_p1_GENE_NODE_1744_length_3879_cov_23_527807_g1125_i0NODE_1744_length_3879_cov_23_527807_g1125_i0_p1_ORF_typecomplete_len1144_score168_73_NODE_1744_length_3879_cov_23_527807_g1125_i04463802